MKGYVYVIGNDELGTYKIGYSEKHPKENRLRHLQVGSPVLLYIAAVVCTPDAPKHEKELHQRFSEKHIRCEWFRLSPEDIESIGTGISIPKTPILVSRKRTLSKQEAIIVLSMEQERKIRISRKEIIQMIGNVKASDHIISSLRIKGWLDRISWGQYILIPFKNELSK